MRPTVRTNRSASQTIWKPCVEPTPSRSSVPQEYLMTKYSATPKRGGRPLRETAAASTSTTGTGLPRPRTDLLRPRALTAAVQLLTAEGWDAVTQPRVATQSGLGRATVYRYWPDRRQLV